MSADSSQRVVDETAASWDVRLRSHRCTEDERDEFNRWLKADVRHQAAYERLQQGLAALRGAASDHPQLRALREVASVTERRARSRRRFVLSAAAAACMAVIAFVVGVSSWHRSMAPQGSACTLAPPPKQPVLGCEVLITAATERRVVSLQDGSSVTLNGSTRIETMWLRDERRIHLLSGRALFRVAKDKTRPFVVAAGDRTVTALGTVFDVRLESDNVQVTLLEGRVAVHGVGDAATQPVLELQPDERLTAYNGMSPTVQPIDSKQESAWAEGQMYFSDEPLSRAIAEMNQHSATQVVIADSALANYRVNGMFRADNQDGFVSAITTYFPIEAQRDGAGHIVLRARTTDGVAK